MSNSMFIDVQFEKAVDIVQSLPQGGSIQTGYDEKLLLYSLYKQATEGDVTTQRPGILDMLGRAKWDAWKKRAGMTQVDAKSSYVKTLFKILKNHPDSTEASRLLRSLEQTTIEMSDTLSESEDPGTTTTDDDDEYESEDDVIQQHQEQHQLPPSTSFHALSQSSSSMMNTSYIDPTTGRTIRSSFDIPKSNTMGNLANVDPSTLTSAQLHARYRDSRLGSAGTLTPVPVPVAPYPQQQQQQQPSHPQSHPHPQSQSQYAYQPNSPITSSARTMSPFLQQQQPQQQQHALPPRPLSTLQQHQMPPPQSPGQSRALPFPGTSTTTGGPSGGHAHSPSMTSLPGGSSGTIVPSNNNPARPPSVPPTSSSRVSNFVPQRLPQSTPPTNPNTNPNPNPNPNLEKALDSIQTSLVALHERIQVIELSRAGENLELDDPILGTVFGAFRKILEVCRILDPKKSSSSSRSSTLSSPSSSSSPFKQRRPRSIISILIALFYYLIKWLRRVFTDAIVIGLVVTAIMAYRKHGTPRAILPAWGKYFIQFGRSLELL